MLKMAACTNSLDEKSMLEDEFQAWNGLAQDPTESIIMIDSTIDKTGCVCLSLLLAGQHEFQLFCPQGYPGYNSGSRFNVDAGHDQYIWKQSLDEFFRDSKSKLLLTNVLDKALSLYKMAATKPTEPVDQSGQVNEAEDEEVEISLFDDDFALLDDSYFTTDWELQVTKLRKNWAMREIEIRETMKKQTSSVNASPSHSLNTSLPSSSRSTPHSSPSAGGCGNQESRQIFSTKAASGVLANDLISILESKKELKFSAEPIKDNIYKWHAKLFKFSEDSDIAADLNEINLKFGYNYIELQLEFTIDLYPFYPPLVKVIRPKLQDSMMQRVTNLDMLKLSYWNPTKDMKTVLMEIREYLEKWARVDVESPRNDPKVYWQGSYTDIEHDLLKLALVSEINPRANQEFLSMMSSKQVHYRPNQQFTRNRGKGNEYWQKGIGYGHNNRPGWDINAFIAAQKEKDKQIVAVLNEIVVQLRNICSNHLLSGDESSESSEDQDLTQIVSLTDLYAIIEGSALLTFLEASLKDVSFLEICRHTSLYKVILDIIKEIALRPKLVGLLSHLPNQHKSISQHLSVLENSASGVLQHVDKIGNGSIPKDKDAAKRMKVEEGSKPSLLMMAISCGMVDSEEMKEKTEEELLMENYNTTVAGETLARQFLCVSHLVRTKLEDNLNAARDDTPNSADVESSVESMQNVLSSSPMCNGQMSSSSGEASASSDEECIHENLEELYYQHLKCFQFMPFTFATTGIGRSLYMGQHNKNAKPHPSQIFRIAQELSTLSSSLPFSLSSTIYVRTDEDKVNLMRALITGPEGTPYSGGCFLFDIYFPPSYPKGPPMVSILTTGAGTVRFNPNLYSSGRVCLSLLGTWEGFSGEQWNETSTILQILVSIQSLILVSDPFFNEPGTEREIGTMQGDKHSKEYNREVRMNCMKWAILHYLDFPAAGFEDVIMRHFYLKKDRILKDVDQWIKEDNNSKFKKSCEKFKTEFKMKVKIPPEFQVNEQVDQGERNKERHCRHN